MADPTSVLLVEDNEYDVHRVEKALAGSETTAFALDHVETLADAVDRLRGSEPDVVLLDLGLPDSRGLETLEAFREAHPEVPLVVLTGLRDEETALAAVTSGAHDYLVKDHLDTFRLVHAIRYTLERHAFAEEAEAALRGMTGEGGGSPAGALVLGVADEVRASTTVIANALTQVRQTLEVAEVDKPGGVDPGLEAADEIAAGVRRIDDLLKALHRFFGTPADRARRASLHEPTVAAVYVFQSVTGQRIGVDADLEPTRPVGMEVFAVQRIVLDLLQVVGGSLAEGAVVRVTTRDDGGAVRLEVTADGADVVGDGPDLEAVRGTVEDAGGSLDRVTEPRFVVAVRLPVAEAE